MSYETAIFDLDGTLLNTLQDLRTAVNLALYHYGWKPRTPEEIRRFVGNGVRILMQRSVPGHQDNPLFEDALQRFKEEYAVHQFDTTSPYPGIPEALQELSVRGVQLAIVSIKVDFAVKDLNARFFGLDIACGDKEGQQRKPAPDVVFAAMEELGADPGSTVYVGDSEVDIQTAANADLPCLSVEWGFRTVEELTQAGAQRIVPTPEELVKIICE